MRHQHQRLRRKIDQVCRQWKKVIILKGLARVLLATTAVFAAAFVLDSFLDLDSAVRIALLVATAGVFAVTVYFALVRPLMKIPNETQLARYLEEKHPHLEDRLVTAIELGDAPNPQASQRIIEKLLEDTRFHIEPLNLKKSINSRGAAVWGSVSSVVAVLFLAYIFAHLDFFTLHSSRLLAPWNFPTVKPKPALLVTPGNTRVLRGLPQEVRVELTGFEAEQLFLYFHDGDSSWQKVEMDASLEANTYFYNIFDLRETMKYYVRADERLSDVYKLTVYEAPRISQVELAYTFPKYTGLKPRREYDGGDVWAPAGTVVSLTATADKPLQNASVMFGSGEKIKTSVRNDSVVTATFTVTQDDYYAIAIEDMDALSNAPAPEYYIHALSNQPPVLTLSRPGRDIKASLLEEVSVGIKVQDDFGTPAVNLKYVVNSSDEKTVRLTLTPKSSRSESARLEEMNEFNSSHLFYLEDLGLQPGDFIGYYVEAADVGAGNGSRATSDIFFVEIRPFEMEFTRPLSQGRMAGGGDMGGKLSKTQKEILIATWKTHQKSGTLESDEFSENIDILVESQENLQEVTQSTLMQMEQRSMFTRDTGPDVTKFYSDAVEAMARALKELRDAKLQEAQTPQREALRNLLLAEAQIREVQIQQQQAQGQGNRAALDELTQLFENEMDKLNSKYETLNQRRQQQSGEEVNEALDKVKELAKRQQESNRKMQDLGRQNLAQQEKKRRAEELRREQEQIRRETQELSRRMQDLARNNQSLPRSVQRNLRQATSEMNNASHNLRNDNPELAAAKGTRALNKLSQLQDLLQQDQKASLRRQFSDMEQQFQDLVRKQSELTQDVKDLTRQEGGQSTDEVQKKQKNLREDFASARQHLENLGEQARRARNEFSREIQRVEQELQKSDVQQEMATAEKMLKDGQLNSALRAEQHIQSMLQRAGKQLSQLRGAMAESEEERLDLALDQTQRLRENLEALQRRGEELSRQASGEQEGGQQSSGERGEKGEAGPGQSDQPRENLDPGKLDWMNDALAKGISDLENIQQSLQADTSLSQSVRKLNHSMEGLVRTFTGGAPNRIELIENQIMVPLRNLEAELAQRLELLKNKEKLFLAREERIPPGYRELVEKYYEALSGARK